MVLISGSPGPQPLDSLTEAALNARLKEIDPLLELKWVPTASWDIRKQEHEGRYAVLCRWPEVDTRWAVGSEFPFDIMCWATEGELEGTMGGADDRPADPEALWELVVTRIGESDMSRGPNWKERLRATAEHNLEVKRKNREEHGDQYMEGLKHYSNHLRKVQQEVVGIDLTKEPKNGR